MRCPAPSRRSNVQQDERHGSATISPDVIVFIGIGDSFAAAPVR
jgi:hypothetical protein